MSKEKYDRILDELSAKKIFEHANMPYQVKNMINSDALKPQQNYTLSVAHYIGRLQRQQQGYEF